MAAARFSELGLRPALCEALARMGIVTPTPVQALLLPQITNSRKDLFVRNVTGSGKSFGAALALLNAPAAVPEIAKLAATANGAASPAEAALAPSDPCQVAPSHLFVVPHGDLACQVESWVRLLLPWDQFPDISAIVQTAFNRGTHISRSPTFGSAGHTVPHILVGTPTRLLAHWAGGELGAQRVDTVILDEADLLTPPPPRFNAKKQAVRRRHPKEIETLVGEVIAARLAAAAPPPELAGADPTPAEKRIVQQAILAAKPRMIALSATTSGAVRDHLKGLGWFHPRRYAVLDLRKETVAPTTLRHVAVCVPSGSSGEGELRNAIEVAEETSHEKARQYSATGKPRETSYVSSLQPAPGASAQNASSETAATDSPPKADSLQATRELVSMAVQYCRQNQVRHALIVPFEGGPKRVAELLKEFEGVRAQYLSEVFADSATGVAKPAELQQQPQQQGELQQVPEAGKKHIEFTVLSAEATRGLHFEKETHIFMLGAAANPQEYLHAAGRVGRMGKAGTVVSFVPPEKAQKVAAILKMIQARVVSLDDAALKNLRI